MSRRNLSDAWKIELALQNKSDRAEIGRKKQKQTLKQYADENGAVLSQVDKTGAKHNTQQEIAEAAGVATGTIGKAEVARKEAPELWEKAKAGKLTVNAAYAGTSRCIKTDRIGKPFIMEANIGDIAG